MNINHEAFSTDCPFPFPKYTRPTTPAVTSGPTTPEPSRSVSPNPASSRVSSSRNAAPSPTPGDSSSQSGDAHPQHDASSMHSAGTSASTHHYPWGESDSFTPVDLTDLVEFFTSGLCYISGKTTLFLNTGIYIYIFFIHSFLQHHKLYWYSLHCEQERVVTETRK